MYRSTLAILCYLSVMAGVAWGGTPGIKPVRVSAGSVLTFYLQTRLNPADGNVIDQLPKGTVLSIKVLDSIDSDVTRDGAEFRGIVVAPLVCQDEVVIHADAQVRGLFALLRSRSHPEGFRYELLITGITDGGKTFQLTASMNPSFTDSAKQDSTTSTANENPAHLEAEKNSSAPAQKQ
jgi:hypothetical protein